MGNIVNKFFNFYKPPTKKNSPREMGGNTGKEFFNFNTLPNELLVEIFSCMQHNDRLKMGLVCKRWFDITRGRRFHLNLQNVLELSEFHNLLSTFKENSTVLPVKCISIKSEIFKDVSPAEMKQFNEIFIKFPEVEVQSQTRVELSLFKNVCEMIPITVKKVIWTMSDRFLETNIEYYETHWINICNAVKCKEIKVVMSFRVPSIVNKEKLRMFAVMSKYPLENITINDVNLNNYDLDELRAESQFNCLKTCKELMVHVTKPSDLKIINSVGKHNLTNLKIRLLIGIEYFMEYISGLENLEELKILNSSPITTFTRNVLSFSHLKEINIAELETVDTIDHESFLASCPNLVSFEVKFGKVQRKKLLDFMKSISQECQFLKKIYIHSFIQPVLRLDDLHQSPESTLLFDDHILHLKDLKNLEELRTPYSIENFTIFEGLKFNKLKILSCRFLSMNEEDAQMLVDACQNLESLTLQGCIDQSNQTNPISVKCMNIFCQLRLLKEIKLGCCNPNQIQSCIDMFKQNNPSLKVTLGDISNPLYIY